MQQWRLTQLAAASSVTTSHGKFWHLVSDASNS
jgi:hypothetical protein